MRSVLAAAAALAAAGLAAGCTSSAAAVDSSTSHPSTPTSASHTTAKGALPAGVVAATDVPAHVPNSARLRADVVLSKCSSRAGGWGASGTAHNPSRTSTQRYVISVFFTTNRATVIGMAATTVVVPPAESRHWSLSATFAAAAPTLCVLRGVGPAGHRTSA